MPKKRPIPKPQTVIRSSAKPLTVRYAELLHLRRAVREAELRTAQVGHKPGPARQAKTSPALDWPAIDTASLPHVGIYSPADLAHPWRGLFLSGSKFLITNSSIE
jgi:hypothetical protein